ncbi:hypothetical protein EI94DRAFT_1698652 [Lactarius quietus]|nr:hypothetical protein EI94DRAFT_1698652 [Lactarius quietus]
MGNFDKSKSFNLAFFSLTPHLLVLLPYQCSNQACQIPGNHPSQQKVIAAPSSPYLTCGRSFTSCDAVILFGLWKIPGARVIVNLLKLFAIGWHDVCHATFTPRRASPTDHPVRRFIGSSILGGLFILGGFDTLVAKILSFVAGVGFIAPLSLVRDKLYLPFHRV